LKLSTLESVPPMSFETTEETTPDGRRAAHVKWDGKTIALGTFSAQEAAEKCNRAKALTKKWRTTMIPKPDVEWVKTTLERLNIRVVNDRPGRRKKRGINEVDQNTTRASTSPSTQTQTLLNNQMLGASSGQNVNLNNFGHDPAFQALNRGINSFNLGGDVTGRSLDRRLSNPSQYSVNSQDRSLAQSNVLNALPNPSNAYNMGHVMSSYDNSSNNYQQEQLLSNVLRGEEPQRISQRSNTTQQQLANLSFGSNQHYEVLKEHHMNLLKELQETTTLMNMYHNNTQNSLDGYGSSLGRNRGQESFDPFSLPVDQSNLLMGSNQMFTSPQSRSNSLGLGGMQMGGVQNLQNYPIDTQLANAARRESLRNAGLMFPMASNESRNDAETNYLSKKLKEDNSKKTG